jgi:signal transduction histidine kinase/ActR/RegA family two-component response regulator
MDFEKHAFVTNALVKDLKAETPSTHVNEDLVFELDDGAQCLWINDRVKEVFGDVRGKHLAEIFSDQPEVIDRFEEIRNGQEFIYFEVPNEHSWEIRGIRDNGALSSAVITAQPTGVPLNAAIPPSAWSYDLLTNRLTVSTTMAEVFGFSAAEVALEDALKLRPNEMNQIIAGCRRLFSRTAEFFFEEFESVDAYSVSRWLSIRGQIAVKTDNGQVIGLNGSIEDITARVLERQNRQALELKMLRYQKMEAIGDLAGGIAHDFNNILTSVMGYTELALMEASPDSGKLSTYLQEVYQGGRRASELVAKMLTFSRTYETEPSHLDLMQEVKEVVKMLRASLPSLIEIRIDVDEGLPEVFIDRQFFQQLIMNLCINARDAMPSGGTIHMRGRQRIENRLTCDSCHAEFAGEFVELSIEDTGHGVPQEMISRMFEPYVSDKSEGSGMGLAMVHGIMHRQGGHIKVDSIPNDGTEVRLFFKPAEVTKLELAATPNTEIQPGNNRDRRVLVVDDEVSLVYFMRELLQRRGFEVSVATDSHEAWDLFSANPEQFDLVVTDQTMPGLSGVQLAGKMITLKPDLLVMLCTGYSDVVDETNVAQYGIQAFMPKPLDSKEFLRTIDELLVGDSNQL